MSLPYKPPPPAVIRNWLSAIQTPCVLKKLTEWETNFIVSLDNQWYKKGQLSQKQCEILERIYAEKTS